MSISYQNIEIWNLIRENFNEFNSNIDEKKLKSIYDTEIVNPVKFNAGFYYAKPHPFKQKESNDFFNNQSFQNFHNNLKSGFMEKKQMSDFILPATTLLQFYRSKNIVKTNTLFNNSTTKEFFGFDDWQITIEMLCIPEKNRTPQQTRDLVIEWAELMDIINVTAPQFLNKKIFAIAIENIEIITKQGSPNTIPIRLNCISSDPDLLLMNPTNNI